MAEAKYLPGVGAQGPLAVKIAGTLLGDGLGVLIVRGYTYLSRNWKPGDQIYLVGFSRGATAVRALAGLIVAQGLLDPSRYDPKRKNDGYGRAVAAWCRHRKLDHSTRNELGLALMTLFAGTKAPDLTDADFRPVAAIRAVAAFDTVSSLGRPHLDDHGSVTFKFTIMDTVLNDKVDFGFHALSADEVRDIFAPTFWSDRKNVLQAVFPGGHSNVGGGFENTGLSDGALEWMRLRLHEAGLSIPAAAFAPPIAPDPLDIFQNDAEGSIVGDFDGARIFPASAVVHESVVTRWGQSTTVRWGGKPPLIPWQMRKGPYEAAGRIAPNLLLHVVSQQTSGAK